MLSIYNALFANSKIGSLRAFQKTLKLMVADIYQCGREKAPSVTYAIQTLQCRLL